MTAPVLDVFRGQLLDAWRLHQEKHLALIEHVKQKGLESTLSQRGGRTVGQQLVHALDVRRTMLEKIRPDLLEDVAFPTREEGHDRRRLRQAFEASGRAVERLIEESPDGRVKVFQGGLVTFVCYLIAHESHHRGGIVLTLKQAKQPLPRDQIWSLWGWSKAPPPRRRSQKR
jgi:uncharacterized damage-inducible protein DinB